MLTDLEPEDLWEEIENKDSLDPLLEERLRLAGDVALEREDFYTSRKIFTKLMDRDKLQICAERALAGDNGWVLDAALAFQTLDNKNGLFQALLHAEKVKSTHCEDIAQKYIGKKMNERFSQNFHLWNREKGFRKECYSIHPYELIMAHALAEKYDVGIGIAKAGLSFVYMCTLLGLETFVADCHKKGKKNTTFAWKGDSSIKEHSRVLVLDIDVVSGRTSERVLAEITRFKPSLVDLALTLNPQSAPYAIGTLVKNIPRGYGKVYFPKDFSYNHFPQAVERLEQALEK